MHTALLEAAHPWVLTIPCDGPFVADDYVAHDGERMQPVYSLIHRDLARNLEKFLSTGERKIDRWHEQHAFATVDFSENQSMFVNINTPQQLAEIEQLLAAED